MASAFRAEVIRYNGSSSKAVCATCLSPTSGVSSCAKTTATSTSLLRSSASALGGSASTRLMDTSGYWDVNAAIACGIKLARADGNAASRSRPVLSPTYVWTSATAASTWPRISVARRTSTAPASVRRSPTTRSLEQWNPDFRFELSKVVTDGGLRVTEIIGGGCHRSFLCNSDQGPSAELDRACQNHRRFRCFGRKHVLDL